jgi:hypothetical protein
MVDSGRYLLSVIRQHKRLLSVPAISPPANEIPKKLSTAAELRSIPSSDSSHPTTNPHNAPPIQNDADVTIASSASFVFDRRFSDLLFAIEAIPKTIRLTMLPITSMTMPENNGPIINLVEMARAAYYCVTGPSATGAISVIPSVMLNSVQHPMIVASRR